MTRFIGSDLKNVSKTVLMPEDPLWARWVAQEFLSDIVCINKTRNMWGFSGKYQGKEITIIASGIGIPSVGIYSYELMRFYKVNYIIRIGSCSALTKKISLRDLIVAESACSDSTYAKWMGVTSKDNKLKASSKLISLFKKNTDKSENSAISANVFSCDAFYQEKYKPNFLSRKYDCAAMEMGVYGLYANALKLNKNALALLTVSNSLVTGEVLSLDECQLLFHKTTQLALSLAQKVSR